MKSFINTKSVIKRVKFLLNSVHISFDLAKALKWRQLYRLLKKAKKLDPKFSLDKAELKQLAKDITDSKFDVKKETSITNFFNVEIKDIPVSIDTFQFVPFVKPFISFFQDDFPVLLI